MKYEQLILALLISAIVVYILHRRQVNRDIGDVVINAYCNSLVKSFSSGETSPDSLPKLGVRQFKRTMAAKHPKVKVEVGSDSVTVTHLGKVRKLKLIEP